VDVPYHRGQGGMYVGLECYKPNVPLFGVGDRNDIVQRYPLGAFRLDIGVETCVSVNARGMMAIQHQVSRDGYYDLSEDSKGGSVRPSFVDFIMTCIEEEEDENDENTMVSQDNASVQMSQQHEQHNGLLDITNNGRTDMEDVGSGVRKKARDVVARVARTMSGRGRANSAVAASTAREELSASEEEEDKGPSRKTGRKGKHCDNYSERDGDFGGNGKNVDFGQDEYEHQNADGDSTTAHADSKRQNNEAASRILGELKMDMDMLSFRRDDADAAGQGRKNALEDIRRRRQERLQRRQSLEMQTNNEQSEDDDDDNDNHRRKSYDSNVSQKRRAKSSKAGSRKKQCSSEEEDEHDNRHCDQSDGDDDELNNGSQSRHSKQRQHSNPAQDSQSQSEDDDEDDESDHEDSLDVTADIPHLFSKRSSLSTSLPHLFSKRSSLSTSRHDRGRSRRSNSRGSNRTSKGGSMSDDDDGAGADSDEEVEQEPRMMYGDTKLEFTQDGYDSD